MKTCVLLFACFAIVQSRFIGSMESSVKVIDRMDSVDISIDKTKLEPLHTLDVAFVKSDLLEKIRKGLDASILEKSDTKKLLRRKRAGMVVGKCARGYRKIGVSCQKSKRRA